MTDCIDLDDLNEVEEQQVERFVRSLERRKPVAYQVSFAREQVGLANRAITGNTLPLQSSAEVHLLAALDAALTAIRLLEERVNQLEDRS